MLQAPYEIKMCCLKAALIGVVLHYFDSGSQVRVWMFCQVHPPIYLKGSSGI